MDFKEILCIHLGGLGDCCLSESVFYSLSRHFATPVVGLGARRFLSLFQDYFDRVHGIESARWLYLFSCRPSDITWERIVFIGKDREGDLRERWQRFSRSPLIFIDMYPEGAFGESPGPGCSTHVEDYQLGELSRHGVSALKKEVIPGSRSRVILYPEKGFKKEKWLPRNFIALYHALKSRGVETLIMESIDLKLGLPDTMVLHELDHVREFFSGGGIFVSNDSGMAHLAGMCGLFTVTVFTDFDPLVWRPRGDGCVLKKGVDPVDIKSMEKIITDCLRPPSGEGRE
jgi:ADP-heptose:LPS heptosyltransferase